MKRLKAIILIGLPLLVIVLVTAFSTRVLVVYEHLVHIDNLPPHLEGLRILQISDLHSNHPTRINMDIWPYIWDLEFDLAVITGDIVLDGHWGPNEPIVELNPHKEQLAKLARLVPTFFVEGNHESAQSYRFKPIMENLGIHFLFNERSLLYVGGGYLEIIGTKDHSTMVRQGFDGLDELFGPDFALVLTHQPQLFDRFKHHGSMLVLAGHTHGGQIRLPFLPVLYAPGQGIFPRYGKGFYYYGEAVLYVSRGVGTTYFPLRFLSRPEIAVFELMMGECTQ